MGIVGLYGFTKKRLIDISKEVITWKRYLFLTLFHDESMLRRRLDFVVFR